MAISSDSSKATWRAIIKSEANKEERRDSRLRRRGGAGAQRYGGAEAIADCESRNAEWQDRWTNKEEQEQKGRVKPGRS